MNPQTHSQQVDHRTFRVETTILFGGDPSGWNARADIDVSGTPEIVRLTVLRQDADDARVKIEGAEPVPFSARLMRDVGVTALTARANNGIRKLDAINGLPKRGLLGRRGTDHRLATVAAYYVDALAKGSRKPRSDAAERLKLTSEQVRDALHEARRRGFLTVAPAGKAGGALTPEALKILSGSGTR